MTSIGIDSNDFKTVRFNKQFIKGLLIGGTLLGISYLIFNNFIWYLNI